MELAPRWCGCRPKNSRNRQKKMLEGRPNPRAKCAEKTTRSSSSGTGTTSFPEARVTTSVTGGNLRARRRRWMTSSVVVKPSHEPFELAISRCGEGVRTVVAARRKLTRLPSRGPTQHGRAALQWALHAYGRKEEDEVRRQGG